MFTDVSLVCADNKHVSAHKLVLAITSQYFQDILYPPVSASLDTEPVTVIRLPGVDQWIMQKYLTFIYTEKLEFNSVDDVWDTLRFIATIHLKYTLCIKIKSHFTFYFHHLFYSFSKKVKHVGLRGKCIDAALKSLNLENVIHMLEKSINLEEKTVEEGCWRWSVDLYNYEIMFII